MILPAGVLFVIRCAFFLSILPASVYCVIRTLHIVGGLPIPGWAAAIAYAASNPLYFAIIVNLRRWSIERDAARHGAALAPLWKGRVFGNRDTHLAFMLALQGGFLGDNLWEKLETLGTTFRLRIFWGYDTVTTDAHIIKAMLATDFDSFDKGAIFRGYMHSVLGDGIFNVDDELWKFHRSMTRPFFTRERIHDYDLFERHSELTMNKLKERMRTGYAVDFQDLVSRFTMDSATEYLFGQCVHVLNSSLPYPHNKPVAPFSASTDISDAEKFSRAFASSQHVVARRSRLGWIWPLYEVFSRPTDKHIRVVDSFLNPILSAAIKRKEKRANSGAREKIGEEDNTLLDHLVDQTTDPGILHDEVLNILIAGRDTTSSTMTFAVYFLSQYPDVMTRLRREVLQTVGPTRRPTANDIKDMKYLRAVINETLRLYPPVPFNIRFSKKAMVFPNSDPNGKPIYVPANTGISYSVYLMHQRKDYWGPDASEFDPDRFLDERLEKYLVPNPFIFLPFNAGPRICLGQQFAYTEMSYFLIKLLQSFSEITRVVDAQDPSTLPPPEWANYTGSGRKAKDHLIPGVHLTLYIEGGLWVRMKEATEADNEEFLA